jgi:hypothetical protein
MPSVLDMFLTWNWQTGAVIFGLSSVAVYSYRSRTSKYRQLPLPPGPPEPPLGE